MLACPLLRCIIFRNPVIAIGKLMEYKTTVQLSKAYFSECFDQSILYGNNRRKVEFITGSLALIAAISLILFSNIGFLPILILIIFGIYELFNPVVKKVKWVNEQMSSKIADTAVDICINDTGITSNTPFTENYMSWPEVGKIIETPKGLLIWPQQGMHIYLQKESMPDEIVQFILSKAV